MLMSANTKCISVHKVLYLYIVVIVTHKELDTNSFLHRSIHS